MASPQPDKFVRLSTELFEAILRAKFTGVQLHIVLWVVRNTYGWNRKLAAFSWYRVAKDLSLDRGGVVREGNRLLQKQVLYLSNRQIGVQKDYEKWNQTKVSSDSTDDARQLWMTGVSAEPAHRPAMTGIIATHDSSHRKSGQESSLLRRAIDNSKDSTKTKIDTSPIGDADKPETPLQKVMNHYIAFKGEHLSKAQTRAFYSRYGKAAKGLLEACGKNAEDAVVAITKIGTHLNDQKLSWTLETILRWYIDPSLMKGGSNGHHTAGAAKPIPGKYAHISDR